MSKLIKHIITSPHITVSFLCRFCTEKFKGTCNSTFQIVNSSSYFMNHEWAVKIWNGKFLLSIGLLFYQNLLVWDEGGGYQSFCKLKMTSFLECELQNRPWCKQRLYSTVCTTALVDCDLDVCCNCPLPASYDLGKTRCHLRISFHKRAPTNDSKTGLKQWKSINNSSGGSFSSPAAIVSPY